MSRTIFHFTASNNKMEQGREKRKSSLKQDVGENEKMSRVENFQQIQLVASSSPPFTPHTCHTTAEKLRTKKHTFAIRVWHKPQNFETFSAPSNPKTIVFEYVAEMKNFLHSGKVFGRKISYDYIFNPHRAAEFLSFRRECERVGKCLDKRHQWSLFHWIPFLAQASHALFCLENYGKVVGTSNKSKSSLVFIHSHTQLPYSRLDFGSDKKFPFNDIQLARRALSTQRRKQVEVSSPLFILYNLIYYPSSLRRSARSKWKCFKFRVDPKWIVRFSEIISIKFEFVIFLLRKLLVCRQRWGNLKIGNSINFSSGTG